MHFFFCLILGEIPYEKKIFFSFPPAEPLFLLKDVVAVRLAICFNLFSSAIVDEEDYARRAPWLFSSSRQSPSFHPISCALFSQPLGGLSLFSFHLPPQLFTFPPAAFFRPVFSLAAIHVERMMLPSFRDLRSFVVSPLQFEKGGAVIDRRTHSPRPLLKEYLSARLKPPLTAGSFVCALLCR